MSLFSSISFGGLATGAMSRWMNSRSLRLCSRIVPSGPLRWSSTAKPGRGMTSARPNRFLPRFIAPTLEEPPFSKPTRIAIYVVAFGFLGSHVFVTYFYSLEPAYGISMLPTLASFGDWVLISKYYRRGRGVRVGDVVSFKHPVRQGEFAIKRIVGLEGDFVLMNTPGKSETLIQIPEGHCWVVGDNLAHSRDSRMFGPLPLALLHGKILGKVNAMPYLPLPQLTWIEHGWHDVADEDHVD